jgi:hypothetical protein
MERYIAIKKSTARSTVMLLIAFVLMAAMSCEVHAAPTKDLRVTPYECGNSSARIVTTCSSKEGILGNNVIMVLGEGSAEAGYVVTTTHSNDVPSFRTSTIDIAVAAATAYSDIHVTVSGTQTILQSSGSASGSALPILHWLADAAARAEEAANRARDIAAEYEAGLLPSVRTAEMAALQAERLSHTYARDYAFVASKQPVSTIAFEQNFEFEKLPIENQFTTCSGDYRVGLIILPPEVSVTEVKVSANQPHTFGKIRFENSLSQAREPGLLEFATEGCPK